MEDDVVGVVPGLLGEGKAAEGSRGRLHPAACHGLDVAAVAEALLRAHPAASEAIARTGCWGNDDLVGTVIFLAALHAIGKFSRPFQAKAPEHWPPVLGPCGNQAGPRHDEVGLRLLRDNAILDVEAVLPGRADEQVDALCCAIAGHHGYPVPCPPPLEEVFPAGAGMNRKLTWTGYCGSCVPRRRGDESVTALASDGPSVAIDNRGDNMSDEPDNLVLELLRALRADIAQVRADTTAMRRTLSDHSHKLSALTGQVAQLRSAGGGDAGYDQRQG